MSIRVFCSHRVVDKPRVELFARRLREDGIDAWLDKWEIRPGDDVVKAMEAGLDECEVGLVFLSSTPEPGGAWMRAEVSVLTSDRLEGRLGRLVPVLLDTDAPIPAFLRPLDRRRIDDYEAVRDAILGVVSKPPLGSGRSHGVVSTVVVRAARGDDGALTVELVEDATISASAAGLRLPGGVLGSLDRFLDARVGRPHPAWTAAQWRLFEADLVDYGRDLGAVLFAGAVGEALAARLAGMGQGESLNVVFEADDELLMLPVEAARLAARGDVVLALEPRVRVRRRPASLRRQPQPPLPHPLKILVAVAAPEQGGGAVLDLERELHTILAAVEEEAGLDRAEVRVLETASLTELGRALERDAYHVVHLAGHGAPGVVLLEDDDGAADPVTAGQLAGALARSGRPVPLVVLSACATAAPAATQTAGMAAGLVAEGVDRVVAMQARVTDRYATELARGLYRRLARKEAPAVGAALARARQELEEQRRRTDPEAGELRAAEYATATLIAVGDDTPIVDHAADGEPLAAPPVHQVHPLLPQLGADDFIGRRRERRALLRALRDDEAFVGKQGRRPGVALTGIGGVGKSSLAGQAAARLVEEGWALVVRRGPFRLDDLAVALGDGLRERATRLREHAASGDVARALKKRAGQLLETVDDEQLVGLVGGTLRDWRVLVVLDDFEQNLDEGGERFADDAVKEQFDLLMRAAGRSKLLVTCRHPVPGFQARLHELALGPLSAAETRKLVLRLPGLLKQPGAERDEVVRVVGGHPRVLELADALLRRGHGRQPVLDKLKDLAGRERLRLDRRGRDARAATEQAVRLAEADVFLPQLLALLDPAERALLYQAAPSSLPVHADDLAVLTDGDDAETLDRCSRLADLTLFSQAGEDAWFVQRWLAEALRKRDPDRYRAACRLLAMRRLELARSDPTYDNEIEALRNFGSPAQLIGSPGGGREANGLVGGYVRAARVGGV
ncbi:MAG: CHAT domain-containing protein [Egibacteraceae bacterium]